MSYDFAFTSDSIDYYLRALGREFRKLNGKNMRAELVLVGGASVLVNYGFRDSTYDIDAVIAASSAMKDAINNVGERLGLPRGWLNSDFTRTESFSPKLVQYSNYYKTFSNILEVRTVAAEYLIAMKLMAGREYKNDQTDIIGIINEHERTGHPITREMIVSAAETLYGGWPVLPKSSRSLLDKIIVVDDLNGLYLQYRESESAARDILSEFHAKRAAGANGLKPASAQDILDIARNKMNKTARAAKEGNDD
ncbi:MAG: nucleotidyltransferase [Clostridiales Family XIII bacterium]|jgi:hypothetical protein|nr:nucleotidyltransferase [Clostridiales Family XIII bacterium]